MLTAMAIRFCLAFSSSAAFSSSLRTLSMLFLFRTCQLQDAKNSYSLLLKILSTKLTGISIGKLTHLVLETHKISYSAQHGENGNVCTLQLRCK